MKIRNIILILSIIVLGCKDEFLLDSKTYESLIVVDGSLTNAEGPSIVKISKSLPVNYLAEIPYENCIVTLIENTGKTEILTEIEPGKYMTSESGMKGIIGNEYSISIFTPEGKEYHSDFQELKEPVDLESVYADSIKLLHIDYPFGLPGYQFYVDTKTAPTKENYFLWSMTETFEYEIDYELAYVETRFGDYLYSNPRYDTLKTCWKTQKVNYIFTGSTSKLSVPQIKHQPLLFVGTDSKKLSKRYSVLIQQYTIGKNAYNYWQGIEEQSSNENFLEASQPYTIKGNIENINNEAEIVLGYFTVASVFQKRIFVDKPDNVPFYNIPSVVKTDPIEISDYKRNFPPPYFWVEVEDTKFGIIDKLCIDCRNEGGNLEKPEFWIDQ
ncbi:MAG: DUF4249 domain-containing protein [Bacteroidales bacterium]|nr:DUF4249 domain-containing protein [Bacteroidales bacterium]